jgi:D-alanyl-D-alanine carboxypeptidase
MSNNPAMGKVHTMKYFLLMIVAWLLPVAAEAKNPVPAPFIAQYAKDHNFNGTVLVAERGKPTYQRSFGLANFAFSIPNTNATKFKVASITKAFTAVLILQLQEQGRIDLQKTIGVYLPDYAGEGRDRVTIHQLLNHTSGIDNMDKVVSLADAIANGVPPYQSPYTSDQILAKFASGKLVHPPGTAFDYNNADYVILGKILERIYSKPFEAALKERILIPLGLNNTGMMRQHVIIKGLADTYFYRDDIKMLVPDFPGYAENWFAAGALYSTATDILTFSNALFDGKLLRPGSLALMIKPGMEDYGYGVWSYEAKVGSVTKHIVKRPGQIMGAQTQLYRYVEDDVTVIILSNTGTADLDEFVTSIGKMMVGYN